MSWPALESDPEIFTNYFRELGLSPEWEFGEVYSMDEEVPGSALILVYKSTTPDPAFHGESINSRYFIRQVEALDNACGLLAGLHAILNSDAEINAGSTLEQLKAGVEDKDSRQAAEWLLSNAALQNAHNAYAAEGQSNLTNAPEHHFIAVLDGLRLFDGMKESPIAIGDHQGFSLKFFQLLAGLIENGTVGADISVMVLRRNL